MHTQIVCQQTRDVIIFMELQLFSLQYNVYNYVISSCLPIFCYYSPFTAQCPELPPILNGAIRYGPDFTPDFDSGTLATHSCDLGFRRVGVQTRVCLISMTWSDEAPVCERKIHLIQTLGKQVPLLYGAR